MGAWDVGWIRTFSKLGKSTFSILEEWLWPNTESEFSADFQNKSATKLPSCHRNFLGGDNVLKYQFTLFLLGYWNSFNNQNVKNGFSGASDST